jgi:hypothetical protein
LPITESNCPMLALPFAASVLARADDGLFTPVAQPR